MFTLLVSPFLICKDHGCLINVFLFEDFLGTVIWDLPFSSECAPVLLNLSVGSVLSSQIRCRPLSNGTSQSSKCSVEIQRKEGPFLNCTQFSRHRGCCCCSTQTQLLSWKVLCPLARQSSTGGTNGFGVGVTGAYPHWGLPWIFHLLLIYTQHPDLGF